MINERYVKLIRSLIETGSMNKTAKELGLSYRTVWKDFNFINTVFNKPLFKTKTGGSKGGGVELTIFGEEILKLYDDILKIYDLNLSYVLKHSDEKKLVEGFLNRKNLRTSARNQFFGKVSSIEDKGINSIVTIKCNNGDTVSSLITNESIKVLDIEIGKLMYAIFKANWVEIGEDLTFEDNFVNLYKGKVDKIKNSHEFIEVTVKTVNGSEIISVLPRKRLVEKIGLNDEIIVTVRYKNIILGV